MRETRHLLRFAGADPQPFPVYRPPLPGLAGFAPQELGIAAFALGAIGQLEQLRADLLNEEAAILGLAEAGQTPSQEQFDRLGAIQEQLPGVETNLASLKAARERRRAEPTQDAVDEAISAATSPNAPTPFKSLGEFLVAVRNAAVAPHSPDRRLLAINAAAQGANELIGSDGGFLVQTDHSAELLTLVHETGQLSRQTDRRPIGANANGMSINLIDETSRVDGSRWGGVQAYWSSEAGSLTASRPKYAKLKLDLGKLIGLYYATDEELADVSNLEANVTRAFAEEFGFKVDDAIVRGTGAGMPLGWLNAGATVSVSKETGQAAATILGENVKKMYARMHAPSVGRAVWFINQDCWPQIFELHQVIGTGGVPLFVPAGGISGAPFGTLLGRPIQPIEQASTLGTVGDINFVDLSQYLSIEKGGITPASSIHVAFTTDEQAFRWTLRTNGRPKRDTALTPFKGSNTQSAFITLATRA